MKTAALIYNPRAGSWRTEQRIAAIQFALEGAGFDTEPWPTEAPGHATVLAGEAASTGPVSVRANGNAMPSFKIRRLSTGKSSAVRG